MKAPRSAGLWRLAVAFSVLPVRAEVVFDGSVGPLAAGTTRTGNFIIQESDGQLSGSNLFHSFDRLNVHAGEAAAWTHSTAGVLNIISRVTGDAPTNINGRVSVGQTSAAGVIPTSAALWLINPSGLVIGEGAAFESNGAFRMSSGNEISFSNGESFFSHDVTASSTLSFASPEAFGFLAGNPLPASVTPGSVRVDFAGPSANNSGMLFFTELTLVGTHPDSGATGLRLTGTPDGSNSSLGAFTELSSTQVSLHALAPGEKIGVSPDSAIRPVMGSGIEITDTDLFVVNFGAPDDTSATLAKPALRVSGHNITIDNAFFQTLSTQAPADLQIDASGQLVVNNSGLVSSTFSLTRAGDINVNGQGIRATGSFLSSSSNTNLGNAGNLNLVSGTDGIALSNTSAFADAIQGGSGGHIRLDSAGDIALRAIDSASSLSIVSNGNQSSGDISLTAANALRIEGGYSLTNNTIAGGDAGSVLLSAESVTLETSAESTRPEISTSTVGRGAAGQIRIEARDRINLISADLSSASAGGSGPIGGIRLAGSSVRVADSTLLSSTNSDDASNLPSSIELSATGDVVVSGGSIQSNTGGSAPAGRIVVTAGADTTLEQINWQTGTVNNAPGLAGDIMVASGGQLTLRGDQAQILTNNDDLGDAGNISFIADSIILEDGYAIQSAAAGGDAGTINLSARRIMSNVGNIVSTSETGGGGDVNLLANQILLSGDTGLPVFIITDSFSSDEDGNGGSITLGSVDDPARSIVIRASALTASAEQGNGGRINVNADAFLRDANSILSVTSVSGEPGVLEINAPQQDISASIVELSVPLLDQTDLIQDLCATRALDRSSLVLNAVVDSMNAPDDYFSSLVPATAQSQEATPPISGDFRGPGRKEKLQCAD